MKLKILSLFIVCIFVSSCTPVSNIINEDIVCDTVDNAVTAFDSTDSRDSDDFSSIDTDTASETISPDPVLYGDRTEVKTVLSQVAIESDSTVNWDKDVIDVDTRYYFDICEALELGNYPDNFIIKNKQDNIKLKLKKYPSDDPDQPDYYKVIDVNFNNTEYHLPEPLSFVLRTICAFVGEEIMIIGNQSNSKNATLDIPAQWYILTPTGICIIDNNVFGDGFEIKFGYNDEKSRQLIYYKTNADFVALQDVGSICKAFTSNNQFYMEYGSVKYENGEVYLIRTLYQTINDYYHSDTCWFKYLRNDETKDMDDLVKTKP
jgi:hypothetical protein